MKTTPNKINSELLASLAEMTAVAALYSGHSELGSIRKKQIERARAAINNATIQQAAETMTADTITLKQIEDLTTLLSVACDATFRLGIQVKAGKVTPAEAAEEINETMRLLAIAAK